MKEFVMNAVKIENTAVDIGIDGECPICTKNRDPATGNPPLNAKAKAAMEEARAMVRGEIPAKWHKPHELEAVLKDLLED